MPERVDETSTGNVRSVDGFPPFVDLGAGTDRTQLGVHE